MKRFSSMCLVLFLISTGVVAQDSWRPLFDGKSLDGWAIKSGYATYEIEDGVILGKTAEGSKNTFLCTADEFGDFELTFEVKVDKGLNSGVQIRSKFKADKFADKYGGRVYGPQVEIETGPGQAGWIYGEATGRGWLSPEPQSKDKAVNQHDHFKNDGWNTYRVVAKGANIKTYINGVLIADLTDEEIYRTHPKGVIGLQVHGIKSGSGPYEVRWRNLKIKSL
ncbi:MAG: DUF1080 domain-containing protein [Planctomycetota bacterium]